jgi:hypothetical protein
MRDMRPIEPSMGLNPPWRHSLWLKRETVSGRQAQDLNMRGTGCQPYDPRLGGVEGRSIEIFRNGS